MKAKYITVVLAFSVFFTSCGLTGGNAVKPYEVEDLMMGTVITQRIYGENAELAAELVSERMKEIEERMTVNSPGGEINALNEAAGEKSVALSPDTFFVIEKALQFSQRSGGAFDITVEPLVKAWAVNTDNPRIPPREEIDRLKASIDFRDVLLYEDKSAAMLKNKGQAVDLGAIAKGYAGDEALRIYRENGIKSAYVNLGGNVVVLGSKPDGSPWKIGIQDPRGSIGEYMGIATVADKAVVTSGDYQRYFESNGTRYHHIIDPETGYPADSGLISATVITELSIDADALSTAAFVLGPKEGMELIGAMEGVEAIFITRDKKVHITPGLNESFKLNDESGEYQYAQEG